MMTPEEQSFNEDDWVGRDALKREHDRLVIENEVLRQERDALRTALRLLLRYVNSTNESRWGEWASRLFRNPDEYVNLKMVQDALRDVEKIAEAR